MKNTIKEALEEKLLTFRMTEDDGGRTDYHLGMSLENGRCDAFIDVRVNRSLVSIYVINPNHIPMNRRTLVSEFLTRANYGIMLGIFEIDYNDGEVRYKSSYAYEVTFPESKEVFLRNLYVSFNTMDKYLPGIMSVVYAGVPPKSAVLQIEDHFDPGMN